MQLQGHQNSIEEDNEAYEEYYLTKKAKVDQREVKSPITAEQPKGWAVSDKIITNISEIKLEAP